MESNCQFFTKHVAILGQILTLEGLSADPPKVRNIFDFPECQDKKQLQAFIGIVNYLPKLLANLAGVAPCLTELEGTTRTCRWTHRYKEAWNQCKNLINNG